MNFLEVASSRTIFDSLDITENTKQDYLSRLPQFLGFVNRNGITRDLLLDYKKYLRHRTDLSVASKNKYLAVARMTLRELHRQGQISADLSVGVKSFQQSIQHKVFGLTDLEVEKISNHLRIADDSFSIARLRALMALLLFQGLRQVEICRMDVSDVDLVNRVIYVLGKARDDKEPIHIHPETVRVLRKYLLSSRVKDGPLFTSIAGQRKGMRLSTRGLRSIIQRLFHELHIERTVHGTRHYFTTQLIKHYKSDLTTVARYTRHSGLEMLNVYNDAVISRDDLVNYQRVFARFALSKIR